MNRLAIGLLGCFGIIAASAAPVEATPNNGWKAADGGWTIDYPGQGYPRLSCRTPVKPETFYRINWRKTAAGGETPISLMRLNSARPQEIHCGGGRGTYYWYSGSETELKFDFYFNPGPSGTVRISGVEVTEVASEALTENLLPNGDWENGAPADFWTPGWGVREWYASLVSSPGFLSGEKSLLLAPAPEGRRYAIISGYMPAVPGMTVELRFWAKADREATLVANIDCQSPSKQEGKHLYKLQSFKLDTDWREYVLRFELPTDLAVYPALADRAARIHFGRETGSEGNIWLDNVEFRQVKTR